MSSKRPAEASRESSAVTEYRVVCASYGERGHSSHHWPKRTQEKAEASVADSEENGARLKELGAVTAYYAGEHPRRIQTREVTDWTDLQ